MTFIAIQIVWLFIGFFTCTANIISFISLLRCKRLGKNIRNLSLNLALTDILYGITVIAGSCVRMKDLTNELAYCLLIVVVSRWLAFTSMFTITLFALDRFASIYFPMIYIKLTSKRLLTSVYCSGWILAGIMTSVSYTRIDTDFINDCIYEIQSSGFILLCVCALLCFITVVTAYTGIIINIWKHVRKFKEIGIPAKKSMTIQYRSSFKIGLILTVFFLTYSPVSIYRLYEIVYTPESLRVQTVGRNITGAIYLLNSLVNPLLYALRFKECRLEMMNLVCFFNNKKISSIVSEKKKIRATYLNSPAVLPTCSGHI